MRRFDHILFYANDFPQSDRSAVRRIFFRWRHTRTYLRRHTIGVIVTDGQQRIVGKSETHSWKPKILTCTPIICGAFQTAKTTAIGIFVENPFP
jgi:hypothetical protein